MKWFAFLLILMILFSGCGDDNHSESKIEESSTIIKEESSASVEESSKVPVVEAETNDMFTSRDQRTEMENVPIYIELNGDSANCESGNVKVDGSVITIKQDGTYVLTGTLNDGMIIVDVPETAKPQLVLDGVNIHSKTSAPIYIIEGDKVFVTLAEDSVNKLSNGGSFEAIDDNNIDAVIFSKQDLTINGSGSLEVNSPAGHGIVSKDDLVLTGGTYIVNSAFHGLDANDSVRIKDAVITIDAGKDGIHTENNDDAEKGFLYITSGTFHIEAEGDGMSAQAYLQIEDGTFDIISGGGSVNAAQQTSPSWGGFMGGGPGGRGPGGMGGGSSSSTTEEDDSSTSIKGIKSSGNLTINGGTFAIDSADDAVHTNLNGYINGGSFTIASGDDAFHADETLEITAGTMDISKSYEGLEGLHIVISGGDIRLVASDDGLNAAGGTDSSGMGGFRGNDKFGGGPGGMSAGNGSIMISGGNLYINASGDGIDANGSLEITGGYTIVVGPTMGDTATLDYDTSAVISGGTFIGTGASGMAQTFSGSENQGVMAVNVGSAAAGTNITLTDGAGKELISYAPELSFNVVILSSPDIIKGETYTITVGSASGSFAAE